MDCRRVRELADSYLSEQLLVETNHEVLAHLEACDACRSELTTRRAMRDKLRGAFARAEELQPRPEFASELAERLRPMPRSVSRRTVVKSSWAAAAGVLLAAGGGLFVRESRSRSRLLALARTAAGDHQNCAITFALTERPIPLEDAGQRYGAPYAQLASFELPTLDQRVDTLDRHSCVYDGRRFGHIVLRFRGSVVSLLVTVGEQPDAPQLETEGSSPAIASLPAGRFVAFVVSDLGDTDVLRIARTIAKPLAAHLA
jgi:anti-sigma factor RsiW